MKVTDLGSQDTFVRKFVNRRRNYFQNACANSMAQTTSLPLEADCCVPCQDEDLLANVPGYSTTDNITNPLNGDLSYPLTVEMGLDSTDSKAIKCVGSKDTCVTLGAIANDAPYSRICLQQPEKCDYGLSASVWVNFTSDSYLKQILLSTVSGYSQGFQFYTYAGKLSVLVVGSKGRWEASVDNFDKKIGKWRLLGFTWERSTGIIQIYIDSVVQTFYYQTTYTEPNAQGDPATFISLGCEVAASGSSSSDYAQAIIIHPALWLWPIRQENLILLTGALVYKLIKYQAPATTPVPTTAPKPSFEYSTILKEAKIEATEANPFYMMADYYLRGYDLQNNVSAASHNISVTETQSRNASGLAHFKFTASPAIFHIDGVSGVCLGNFDLCTDGVSMSLWIAAYETLPTTSASDMDVIRLSIFTVRVYNASSMVRVQVQAYDREISTVIGFKQWSNIGAIYRRGSVPVMTLYVNGLLKGSSSTNSGTPLDNSKVTLGSTNVPTGVLLNDVAVWYRSLEEFEVHKFLGYTRDQLRYIRQSTHYWTTDQFVLSDGLALSETTNYNLRSQYRINVGGIIGSAIKFQVDRYNKSLALKLDKNWYGQIFLGNRFSQTPTESDIMWYGQCITDPYQRDCQINGLSMHMWINIKSVDPTKKQFFFSSGDLGEARSSTLDSRGISLFTTGNLLGASLSTDRNDWAIVIDSNRYELNEWFNIGFTWREKEGMRLFLNGTDYGIKNLHPDISYKAYDKHTRAVIGRFDDDQNTTWKGNSEWVMGNFSYSDIVYYEKWMSPEEFSQSIGSVNNRYYKTADLLVYGQGIIDTDFPLMKQAWLYSVPIGPKGAVSSEQSIYAKINTNGEVGIKAFKADECPRALSACSYQVLFSTWIKVQGKENGTAFTVLSLGGENDAFEGIGIKINADNSLMAWVKRPGKSYKMVTRSAVKVRFDRWLNLGLYLSKTHFYPSIYLNGTNVSISLELQSASAYQASTETGVLKLGLKSSETNSSGSFLAYLVSGWYSATLRSNQMNMMLGIQSSKHDLMSLADDYWAVSGLWSKLQPRPLQGVNAQFDTDKYDVENGAMCTLGTGGSYVSLGDLQDSCLLNTAPCKAFILTMSVKPQMPTSPGKKYILSSGGQNPGHLGTAVAVTSDGFLYATVRSPNKTCETVVPFNYSDWMQLQIRWYSEAVIAVKVDEETISRRAGTNSSCWEEFNDNATYTMGELGKVNNNNTNASVTCFSDVMFKYQLLGSGGTLEADVTPSTCYEQQTIHISLSTPGHANHENKPNRSRRFTAAENVDVGTDVCFFTTGGCPKGLTLSLWLRIVAFGSTNEAEVLNTGFPTRQGIRVMARKVTGANFYHVVIDASFNEKTRHIEGNGDADQVAIGSWVNIGLSMTTDVIELYQNGVQISASTQFTADTLSAATGSTVSLGSSADMLMSDLVVWNEPPLNCLSPGKNKKLLTGTCATSTESLKTTCLPDDASSCKSKIENNMCLDPQFPNVVAIDKTGQLFASSPEATTACDVIASTANDNGVRQDFIQSSLNILGRISQNLAITEDIDNSTIGSVVGQFSKAFSAVMNPRFSSTFRTLIDAGSVNPANIFSSIEGLGLRLASKVKSDCSPVVLTEGRMHWCTQKIGPACSSGTVNPLQYNDRTHNVWYRAKDRMSLPSSLFFGRTDVRVASIVYDQIGNLIPSVATNETNYSNNTNGTIDLTVNSRVISVLTNLPVAFTEALTEPLNITLELKDTNQRKKKNPALRYETRCAYWDIKKDKWSTDGCMKESEDEYSVNCNCYHMTSFAILMQPVPPTEHNIHAKILSILTYILIGISLLCLLILIVVIACSKRLRGERYIIHLNLAAALFVAQLAFVFTEVARENADFCKAIAIIMHFFFVAAFGILFIESLWVFYAVTKGIIRGHLKWWLPVAWLIPAVVVGVVGGMNSSVYGGTHCWISGIYIWSFLGPLVAFGCLTLLVCLIVVCNLKEPAIKRKDILNDLRNHTHQCALLIPLMILAWLFGVLLVKWYSIPIEYFFVIFNAPQGFWVFLCFGLLNPDFREVICLRRSRSSVGSSSVSITGVQDINSSKTSFETGSQVAIVPPSTSPKQKAKQPQPQPQPQQPQQPQRQSAPVYYTGKEKSRKQQGSDDEETTSSRAKLQASARSLRSAASSRGQLESPETDADRPGTPRTEKFTPPGTID